MFLIISVSEVIVGRGHKFLGSIFFYWCLVTVICFFGAWLLSMFVLITSCWLFGKLFTWAFWCLAWIWFIQKGFASTSAQYLTALSVLNHVNLNSWLEAFVTHQMMEVVNHERPDLFLQLFGNVLCTSLFSASALESRDWDKYTSHAAFIKHVMV